MEGGAVGHKFESEPAKDHVSQIWFNLVQLFQRRKFKCTTDGRQVMTIIQMAKGQVS